MSFNIGIARLLRARFLDIEKVLQAPAGTPIEVLTSAQLKGQSGNDGMSRLLNSVEGSGERLFILPKSTLQRLLPTGTHHAAVLGAGDETQDELVSTSLGNEALSLLESGDVAELPLSGVMAALRQSSGYGSAKSCSLRPSPVTADHLPALSSNAEKLFDAARSASIGAVRGVLSRCSLSDVTSRHPSHGGTCLHVAAGLATDEVAMVNELLDAGAALESVSLNGSTALHWAAGAGAAGVVALLLDRGADPEVLSHTWFVNTFGKSSGQSPAHWAAESNHVRCLELLMARTASSAFLEDERGQLPIDVARKEGRSDVVALLDRKSEESYVCVALSIEDEAHRLYSSRDRVDTLTINQ